MVTQEAGFRIQSPNPLGTDLQPISTCKEIIPHHKLLELANWQSSMLYRP